MGCGRRLTALRPCRCRRRSASSLPCSSASSCRSRREAACKSEAQLLPRKPARVRGLSAAPCWRYSAHAQMRLAPPALTFAAHRVVRGATSQQKYFHRRRVGARRIMRRAASFSLPRLCSAAVVGSGSLARRAAQGRLVSGLGHQPLPAVACRSFTSHRRFLGTRRALPPSVHVVRARP